MSEADESRPASAQPSAAKLGGLGGESPRKLLWESNRYGRSYAKNGCGAFYLWVEHRADDKYAWAVALDCRPGAITLVEGIGADIRSAQQECEEQALAWLHDEIRQITGEPEP